MFGATSSCICATLVMFISGSYPRPAFIALAAFF
jgi:hypothetical protein